MKKKILSYEKNYLLVSFMFYMLMFFYELIPSVIIMIFSLLYVAWSVVYLYKRMGKILSFVITSISVIPTSFISILGSSIGDFPLAWFHCLVLIIFCLIVRSEKIDKYYFIFIMLFLMVGICSSLQQPNFFDGIKQVMMMLLCLFSFIIGDSCKKKTSKSIFNFVYEVYVFGTIIMAILVIIQYMLLNIVGIEIANVGYYSNRVAYGGLMNDFSFVTTYIATGFMAVMLSFFEYKTIGVAQFLIFEVVLMIGITTISARTGLFALLITVVLYFVTHLNRFKLRYMIVIIVSFFSLPLIFEILLINRGGQALLDDSGRMNGYLQALTIVQDTNILLGVGFGLSNITNKYSITIPHNFFVQYLLQGGVLGVTIILAPFVRYIYKVYRKVDCSIWLLCVIGIAAMAIPDIMSSRFLYATLILCQMSSVRDEKL